MEQINEDAQIKPILMSLMAHPYSETEIILQTEQKLKDLYQKDPQNIEILIGLLFSTLMRGERQLSLGLSQKIWNIGTDLSPFFKLVYLDCLLNLNEFAKADLLIKPLLEKLSSSLDYFYMVIVKYALLKGDLFLLTQIKDYQKFSETEPVLFEFAQHHAFDSSSIQYQTLISIVKENVKDKLCSFEYMMYSDGIELNFYLADDDEKIEELQQTVEAKITESFDAEAFFLEDLFIRFENIANHYPWLEAQ